MEPKYVVIHHSLTKDGEVNDWEAIRRYHKEEKGWDDIGYHLGVERIGGTLRLMTGRKWDAVGAHCKEAGMNSQSLGVCVVGNFDIAPPDLETLHYLKNLCFSIMVNYDIPANNVIGHRDAGLMVGEDWRVIGSTGIRQYKSCPGVLFPMDTLRSMLVGKPDEQWDIPQIGG